MRRKGRRRLLLLGAAALLAALIVPGLDSRLAVRTYQVESGKLTGPARLALITDFHSCDYGEGQGELLDALRAARPDLVLLGGDILDDGLPPDHALELAVLLSEEFPCYYVSGNHESRSGRVSEYKESLRALGVAVLEGERVTVTAGEQSLDLCGVDDPSVGEDRWAAQLAACAAGGGGRYTVLLTHRPERIDAYLAYPFDLVLAGHAHGGQWRIPGLINGLMAPNQGAFPKCAGGRYDLGETVLVVSRGLARESTRIPRLYNRPELVLVDLTPSQSQP